MYFNQARTTVLFVSLSLCACAAPVPVRHPEAIGRSAQMERETHCLETRCQHFTRQCEQLIAPLCSDCLAGCLGSGSASACSEVCGCNCHLNCAEGNGLQCFTAAYTFRLPNSRDERLAGACASALARDQRCHERSIEGDCDVIGRIERPEHASIYDCIARTACGTALTCTVPPPSSLGDDLCAAERRRCAETGANVLCGDANRDYYNNMGPWLDADALAALRSCLDAPECQPLHACVSAWMHVTYAATP